MDTVEIRRAATLPVEGRVIPGNGYARGKQSAHHRQPAKHRVAEHRLMRGPPAPRGRVAAIHGRQHLGRLHQSLAQHRRAIAAAPMGTGRGERIGHGFVQRPGGGWRNAGLSQQQRTKPAHPHVEDQRLRQLHRHLAVPAFEQRQRLCRQSVRRPDRHHRRQHLLRKRAFPVHLHARETLDRVAVGGIQQGADAPGPPVTEPVTAEKDRKVGGGHAFVGVQQPSAGWRHEARQLHALCHPDPVMLAAGTWNRLGTVAGPAHRDPAGDIQRDALAVGDQHVLRRRGDQIRRPAGLLDIGRLVQRLQPGRRGVAGAQIGHGDREHRFVALIARSSVQVGDHRTMAGFANNQNIIRPATHLDPFLMDLERGRAIGRQIAAFCGRRLNKDVLHIGAGGRESPGDVAVMAHHQKRHTRRGGADQQAVGSLDPCQIPDAGLAERQVRIAGQQRRAGGAVTPVHRPLVGGARRLGIVAGKRRQPGQQPAGDARQHMVGKVMRHWHQSRVGRQHAAVRRPDLVEDLRRHRSGNRQPEQLGAPVGAEPQPHHLAPQQAVDHLPRPGLAQQHELQTTEPAARANPRVDAARIGLHQRERLRRQARQVYFGPALQAEHPHCTIERKRRGAKQLRQLSLTATPHHVHLEQPVAGMNEAERRCRVDRIRSPDTRHAVLVERNVDRCRQSGYRCQLACSRKAPPT